MTGVVVLICGMVFTSRGFPPGTVGYQLMNVVAAVSVLLSTAVFVALLVFEVCCRCCCRCRSLLQHDYALAPTKGDKRTRLLLCPNRT